MKPSRPCGPPRCQLEQRLLRSPPSNGSRRLSRRWLPGRSRSPRNASPGV